MPTELTRPLRSRIERTLDRLRPALVVDGGNVELVEVDEHGTVHVELQGRYAGSAIQQALIHYTLEPALRADAPEVTAVVAV